MDYRWQPYPISTSNQASLFTLYQLTEVDIPHSHKKPAGTKTCGF